MIINKKLAYRWLRIQRKFIKAFATGSKQHRLLLKNKLNTLKLRSLIQEETLLRIFGPYAKGILFESYNGNMIGSVSDVQVNNQLGYHGQYNKSEIDVLSRCLNNGSVLYVVGTHIGTLLVPLAKHAGKVYGMDANPDIFEFLKKNILLNELHNVEVFSCAVYHENTTLEFYQNTANSGGSKIRPKHDDFRYNYDTKATICISAFTLDTLQQQKGWAYPDCIIMDIEGAEYFALKGGTNCLQHASYLYIEFVADHLQNIANVSLESFLSVVLPYFNEMRIMHEIITGKENVYTKDDIPEMVSKLYENGIHADLLFSKSFQAIKS